MSMDRLGAASSSAAPMENHAHAEVPDTGADANILTNALAYHAAGLCVLPTPAGGEERFLKHPDVGSLRFFDKFGQWEPYKSRRPLERYVARWFMAHDKGICVVTGPVSGNLEALDFDDHGGQMGTTFESWRRAVRSMAPGLYERLYVGQTPGDGYRILYRCEGPTGDDYEKNLAMVPSAGKADRYETLIEWLAGGKIVMVPGGHPDAHKAGRPYTTVQGDLCDLPVISATERLILIETARSLDRREKKDKPEAKPAECAKEGGGTRPGDEFNQRATWEEVLEPHGWTYSHAAGDVCHWCRPGKSGGVSATTNHGGSGLLHVFSSNAHPFEPDKSYSKFAAFALLNFGGDFAEAAKQLAARGYGDSEMRALATAEPEPDSPAARIRAEACVADEAPAGRPEDVRADDPPVVVSAKDPYQAAHLFLRHNWTDGLGRQLLRHYRQDYWGYDGRRWRRIDIERVRGGLWSWLRQGCVEKQKDGGHAAVRPTKGTIDNVENALRGQCLVPEHVRDMPCWLDGRQSPRPDDVVPLSNGLLDAGSMVLHEHDPAWFAPSCLPHAYDPGAACPRWLRFLDQVSESDPAWVAAMGEWFGYNLVNDVRQHKMAMLAGVSRGGKGVIARMLRELVGHDACGAMDFAQMGSAHGLESLVGKSAAVVGDGHVGRDSDTVRILERLKSIVGGDPQVVNPKHRAAYDALLRCRFTICVNALPRLPDSSAALRARMLVFPFKVSFEGREDRGLEEDLRAELPGITNWALEGLRRLREKGRLETPESGRHLLDQFVRQNSPVLAFVTDWCVLADEVEASTKDVQDSWNLWCEDSGHHGGSAEYLGTQLLAIGPKIRKVRRTESVAGRQGRRMYYEGIALNEEAVQALKAHRLRYRVRG